MFYNQLQKVVSEALSLCSGIFPQLLWRPLPHQASALVKDHTLSPICEPLPPPPAASHPSASGLLRPTPSNMGPHPKSDQLPPHPPRSV